MMDVAPSGPRPTRRGRRPARHRHRRVRRVRPARRRDRDARARQLHRRLRVRSGGGASPAMLHFLLPDSRINPERARAAAGDVRRHRAFRCCSRRRTSYGLDKKPRVVKLVGGAEIAERPARRSSTGRRNVLAAKNLLWRNGVLIKAEDVGGTTPRTVHLAVGDGRVQIFNGATQYQRSCEEPSCDILIVDDSAMMRAMIKRVIGAAPTCPSTRSSRPRNGAEALAGARGARRAAAVHRHQHAGDDRRRAAARDRAPTTGGAHLGRVIISTDGSAARRDEAADLDVRCYVEKPFRPEVLRDVLTEVCQRSWPSSLRRPTSLRRRRRRRRRAELLRRPPSACDERSLEEPPRPVRAGSSPTVRLRAGRARRQRVVHRCRTIWRASSSTPSPGATRSTPTPDARGARVDLVGEFANMVCGTWLTRRRPTRRSTSSRPRSSRSPPRRGRADASGLDGLPWPSTISRVELRSSTRGPA